MKPGAPLLAAFARSWEYLTLRISPKRLVEALQRLDHSIERSVEHDRRMPQRHQRRILFLSKHLATVKSDREIRILQQIPGKDQHNALIRLHETLLDQPL